MPYIDSYSHFCPPVFLDYMNGQAKHFSPSGADHVFKRLFENTQTLIDLDARLEQMHRHNIERSVLVPLPWIESIPQVFSDRALSMEAAEICNAAMADIRKHYPHQFYCVAILPVDDPETMMAAMHRALTVHKLDGIALFVSPLHKPLDHEDYLPLFAKAASMNVPIWMHPCRPPSVPDYAGESMSKHMIWQSLGWVFDSSCAMVRLAMSGIFNRHPNLKIVTHHHGAMIPLFVDRMDYSVEYFEGKGGRPMTDLPERPLINHLRHFYCDTAISSVDSSVIKQAINFFGEKRVLFGSDSPMDVSGGVRFIENAQRSIAALDVSEDTKHNICRENALNLFRERNNMETTDASQA
jgi:predicted TIM-barrel fold metal-dependent hydrolase